MRIVTLESSKKRPVTRGFAAALMLMVAAIVATPACAFDLKAALAVSVGSPIPVSRTANARRCGSVAQRVGAANTRLIVALAFAQAASDTIFANGFDNTGGECLTDVDCPPSSTECMVSGCSSGLCADTPAPIDSACSAGFCDGSGACVQCNTDNECTPGAECNPVSCTSNNCVYNPSPYGFICSIGYCDGAGTCDQCLVDADCPPSGSECVAVSCLTGTCDYEPYPFGTPCTGGTCDGAGNCGP
jgi:hypothetical protein